MSRPASPAWAERAAERSPLVQRSRSRSVQQASVIVEAARRLLTRQGEFTTQDLVKEAGVALQTFYRYFDGKDQLLLALIEDLIGEETAILEARSAGIADPLERLHFYVTFPLESLRDESQPTSARAITAEHWRLRQRFPGEIESATRPFVELVHRTLVEAQDAGLVHPTDTERDAWLVVELVRTVFFHYAYVPLDRPLDDVIDHVWSFCLKAVGGTAS